MPALLEPPLPCSAFPARTHAGPQRGRGQDVALLCLSGSRAAPLQLSGLAFGHSLSCSGPSDPGDDPRSRARAGRHLLVSVAPSCFASPRRQGSSLEAPRLKLGEELKQLGTAGAEAWCRTGSRQSCRGFVAACPTWHPRSLHLSEGTPGTAIKHSSQSPLQCSTAQISP